MADLSDDELPPLPEAAPLGDRWLMEHKYTAADLRAAQRAAVTAYRARNAAHSVGADGLPSMVWPKSRDVGRLGDMSPPGDTHLRVLFDSDNDVIVEVFEADKFRQHDASPVCSVEFCNGGGGGGQSMRTRAALIALMVAIEQDNADTPNKSWPVGRAARHPAQKDTP